VRREEFFNSLLAPAFPILLCVPSQKGLRAVRLQPHSHIFSASATLNFTGENSLPLCEPSQKG